jgi:hypothetical protein
MIALLLAAQLSAQTPASPQGHNLLTPRSGVISNLPRKACGDPSRIEALVTQPAALYRKGDRPPRPLLNWADYPDGQVCPVEAAR